MRRREFITLLGGTAAAWPMAARAQSGRVRRVAVLMNYPVHHPEAEARVAAFRALMRQAGWIEGQNIQIDFYSGAGGPDHMRSAVATLVGLSPDVIVSSGTPATKAAQDATRSIPIVFANVADPVGTGIVSSLAKPGGITTGFVNYEYPMGGKWLETLKEIAPGVSRFAVMHAVSNPSFVGFMREIESAATRLQVQITATPVRNEADIESSIELLGRQPNVGLIVLPDGLLIGHRNLIVRLVARNKIPTIYSERVFASIGGLISYAYDAVAQFGQTASYVDRILKGTKPSELPVQQSVRFELVVNLQAAKALGIAVSSALLARADEVIE
jgi:putative tryptophan/tyrosine transport system substrate-binding protein